MKYFYCPCDGGLSVNPDFRFYFRLYKEVEGVAILVEQGLAHLVDGWIKKYDSVLDHVNPYPQFD